MRLRSTVLGVAACLIGLVAVCQAACETSCDPPDNTQIYDTSGELDFIADEGNFYCKCDWRMLQSDSFNFDIMVVHHTCIKRGSTCSTGTDGNLYWLMEDYITDENYFVDVRSAHDTVLSMRKQARYGISYQGWPYNNADVKTTYWTIIDETDMVTHMKDYITDEDTFENRIGLGAVRVTEVFGDNIGSWQVPLEKGYTRIGFTKQGTECRNPINVVGMLDDNEIIVGPFYEPGKYIFCVSKDAGKVWSAQDSSLLIEVVASPGPGAFSFATTVVEADDNTQRIDGFWADTTFVVADAEYAFVPAGTPCNVSNYGDTGKGLLQSWFGTNSGEQLNALTDIPDYPQVPTMTQFVSSAQSGQNVADRFGQVLSGVYYPPEAYDGTSRRFEGTGDNGWECGLYPDATGLDGYTYLMSSNSYEDWDNFDRFSADVTLYADQPRAFQCAVAEMDGGDHIRIRVEGDTVPFGGPQIGLPVDLLTSSPVTWLGRSDAGENSPHHTLADPITQPGLYDLCLTTSAGATWIKQTSAPQLLVTASVSYAITSIVSPPGAVVPVNDAFTLTVEGDLIRTDGQAFVRVMKPSASDGQCTGGGDIEIDLQLSGLLSSALTLTSGPGLYRLCYSGDGESSYAPQPGMALTAFDITTTTVTSMVPSNAATGSLPNVYLEGMVPGVYFGFCAIECGDCITMYASTLAPATGPPYALGAVLPATPGEYNLCVQHPTTNAWLTQDGMTLTVLGRNALTAIVPSVIGAGTNPLFTFFGAEVANNGTWVAFTESDTDCASYVFPTQVVDLAPTAAAGTLTAPLYYLCYSVNGNWPGAYSHVASVTVTVVTAASDSLSSFAPSMAVAGSTAAFTLGSYPLVNGAQVSLSASALPSGCGLSAVVAATVVSMAVPASPGSYRVCFMVDGLTWVVQDAVLTVIDAAPSVVVTAPTGLNRVASPGQTLSVLITAPITPVSRVAFAEDGYCTDATAFIGGGSYAYTGAAVNVSMTGLTAGYSAPNTEVVVCYAGDGVNFVEGPLVAWVLVQHPNVISELTPTVVLPGGVVEITNLRTIQGDYYPPPNAPAPPLIRLADDATCTYKGGALGPAGEETAITGVVTPGSPITLGTIDAGVTGILFLCYSVDGSVFHPQVRVPVVAIDASAGAAVTSITPVAVALGEPWSVVATFASGGTATSSTVIGFTSSLCSMRDSEEPYSDSDAFVNPPALTVPGTYAVCWFDGLAWVKQQISGVQVVLASAAVDSITSIAPNAVVEGLVQDVTLAGMVGTATTQVGLAPVASGCSSVVAGTVVSVPAGASTTVAMDTSGLANGTYTVCYQTSSAAGWFGQTVDTMTVIAAAASDISVVTPSVVGFGAPGQTVTVDGAVPTSTTRIGFSTDGCTASVLNQVDYTAVGPIAITMALTPDTYSVCYTVNGVNWVEQTSPGVNLRVEGATAAAISAISPPSIAGLTLSTIAVQGLAVSDVTPTSMLAFGAGSCAVSFGRTLLGDGSTLANLTLSSALPLTEPTLVVCYSVDGGLSFVEQIGVTVSVLTAAPDSIALIVPNVWGVGVAPVVSLSGAVDAGFTYVAFAPSTGECSDAVRRVGTTQFVGSSPIELAPIAAAGSYVLCYSMSGNGGGVWVGQEAMAASVSVIQAVSTSVTQVSPNVIGVGTTPTLTFVGAVPSISSWLGFGTAGSCASPDALIAYVASGSVPLPSSLSLAHDVVCYSTNNGTSYVAQGLASLAVIGATNVSVSALSPAIVGTGAAFVMNIEGQEVSSGAELAFALGAAACATGPRVGNTPYATRTGLAVGIPIAAPGEYVVCFSIDGVGWQAQTTPGLGLSVRSPGTSAVIDVTPDAVGVGTTPALRVVLNPNTTLTDQAYIGWSLDPTCATAVGGITRVVGSGTIAVALGAPLGPIGGLYAACLTFSGPTGVFVPQAAAATGMTVATATNTSITALSPLLIPSSVPPTVILTGAIATPTTRVAFAPVGECQLPSSRFGNTPYETDGPLPLASALDTGLPYLVMAACYSVDDGETWVEQTAQTVEVTAECSTLTTCGACHANQFCTFCLSTRECSFNVSGCIPEDTISPSDTCPVVTMFEPRTGDVTGATAVTLGVDYLAPTTNVTLSAINATDLFLECQWTAASQLVYTPFAPFNATHGTCDSPAQINDAPAAALSLLYDGVAYTSDILFFVYYDCSVANYSCGDCVVRAAECGFCLETQACGPARTCNATFTKNACPRVTGLEPSALNFRGDEEVTLSGDLFYDAPTLECAFDGAVAGPATFVSATEAICMAPPGEAGTQVDVGLYVNGRAFTTLAGRLQYESDPSAVDETPIVLYGVVGGGILAVLLILVAVILCCCLRNGKDASYLPPKLTAAQERDLMFGKHDGVSHGKDLVRALQPFVDLMLMHDKSIVNYILDNTAATEADSIAKAFVFIHEDDGQTVRLIKSRISHEVEQALSLATLFRTNSMATKMFRSFARMSGLHYIRTTLGYEINFNLAQFADADLDIKKATGTEDDTTNRYNLLTVCQKIFVAIAKSIDDVPPRFRHVFAHVRRSVEERFPIRAEDLAAVIAGGLNTSLDICEEAFLASGESFGALDLARGGIATDLAALAAVLPGMQSDLNVLDDTMSGLRSTMEKLIKSFAELEGALDPSSPEATKLLEEHANKQNAVAVGGFFFLRFIIPAITNPVAVRIVDEMPPPNQHKMLVLVSKVLQNLSNGINFGGKERGMAQLNEFIDANLPQVRSLFERLSAAEAGGAAGAATAEAADDAGAAADDLVEIPQKIYQESVARLYSHVDRNLEKILTAMRDVEGPESQMARQCAMLLGNVMEQTRAALDADSALAGFRADSTGDLADIFASFKQSDRRASQAFDIEQLRALLGTDAGMLNSFDFGSIRLTRGNDHLPTPDNGGANGSGALPPPPMAGLDAGSGFGAFGGPNDFTTSNPIFTPEVAAAPLPIPTGASDDGGGVYVPDVVPDDDMDNAVELPDIVPSSSSSSSTTSAPPA